MKEEMIVNNIVHLTQLQIIHIIWAYMSHHYPNVHESSIQLTTTPTGSIIAHIYVGQQKLIIHGYEEKKDAK